MLLFLVIYSLSEVAAYNKKLLFFIVINVNALCSCQVLVKRLFCGFEIFASLEGMHWLSEKKVSDECLRNCSIDPLIPKPLQHKTCQSHQMTLHGISYQVEDYLPRSLLFERFHTCL